MELYSPFDVDQISFDNIVYKDKIEVNNRSAIYIKYQEKNSLSNLRIKTPTFFNTESIIKKKNHYELLVPLSGKKKSKIDKFKNFLNKLQDKLIYDAKINSNSWFNTTDKLNYKKIIKNNNFIKIKIIDPFIPSNNMKSIQSKNIQIPKTIQIQKELIKSESTNSDSEDLHTNTNQDTIKSESNKDIIIASQKQNEKIPKINQTKDKNLESKTIILQNIDGNNVPIDINNIPDNHYIKLIIDINALWINKKTFGLFIKPNIIYLIPINPVDMI